jgi:hypothetical protein
VSQNVTLKAEYLHWDLGNSTVTLPTLTLITLPPVLGAAINARASSHFSGDIFRFGVNLLIN